MRSVRSWSELLDRLEAELDAGTATEPFLPPTDLGPLPEALAWRARELKDRLAAAESEVLLALAALRQESALLPVSPPQHPRFVDLLA